jgi:DNA-binding response OmpR family regulator
VTEETILIIDDDVTLARAFALVLERDGYHVEVAHTAAEGLDHARAQPPDAIILDFQMPFVNGVGFLYRLREISSLRNTPVMVVTGATVDEEVQAELSDLRATLRFKPIGMEALLTETRNLLTGEEPRGDTKVLAGPTGRTRQPRPFA